LLDALINPDIQWAKVVCQVLDGLAIALGTVASNLWSGPIGAIVALIVGIIETIIKFLSCR
jgi:hypothetical protein